jgi:hypothetical protein
MTATSTGLGTYSLAIPVGYAPSSAYGGTFAAPFQFYNNTTNNLHTGEIQISYAYSTITLAASNTGFASGNFQSAYSYGWNGGCVTWESY